MSFLQSGEYVESRFPAIFLRHYQKKNILDSQLNRVIIERENVKKRFHFFWKNLTFLCQTNIGDFRPTLFHKNCSVNFWRATIFSKKFETICQLFVFSDFELRQKWLCQKSKHPRQNCLDLFSAENIYSSLKFKTLVRIVLR